MKFIEAWSEVLNQNNALKITLGISVVCTFILCVTTVRLALRDPLVIERECYSRQITPAQTKQTVAEIENFVWATIAKRFDSDAVEPRAFLGEEEYAFRLKEQDELARKSMKQKIYPTSVKVADKQITVEADRILNVGNIRSNVPFTLILQVAATSRSPGNPYGLVFQRISQANKEDYKP